MSVDAKGFETAWDAVGRQSEDVAHLKARAELMIVLTDHIMKQGWTQSEAAARLGVTQPRISDLMRGKFSAFGLDHLVTMLARAGMTVDIRVRRRAARKRAA
jgi:predicted XRE-type DNA-binding protein